MRRILFIFLYCSNFAIANDILDDMDELLYNATSIGEAAHHSKVQQNDFRFDKLRVRLRGKVGLEVPLLSSLELKLFVEPHFKR